MELLKIGKTCDGCVELWFHVGGSCVTRNTHSPCPCYCWLGIFKNKLLTWISAHVQLKMISVAIIWSHASTKKLIKGKLLTQNLFIHRAPFLQQHIYIIEPKCHPCHLGLHVLTQLSINNVKKVPKRLKSTLVPQLPTCTPWSASGMGNLASWKGVIPIGKTGASLRFLPPCHTQFGAIDRRSRLVREVPGLLVPGLLPQLSLSLSSLKIEGPTVHGIHWHLSWF